MRRAYFSLASNLGNRENNIAKAVSRISAFLGSPHVSPLYELESFADNQPKIITAAIGGYTDLSPEVLLERTQDIERSLGKKVADMPRAIDIDILFIGHEVIESDDLVVPHPGIEDRAYVLVPLADIAPDFRHPTLGSTMAEMLADLGAVTGMRQL